MLQSNKVIFKEREKLVFNPKNLRRPQPHGLKISLIAEPSRANLKLHNTYVTSSLVKKVMTNLDLSKASALDCILGVVLKKCQPELSYILTESTNMYPKKIYFQDCWPHPSVVTVFKNVGEMSMAKNYGPVNLLSVISKAFENIVNNSLLNTQKNANFFFISSIVSVLLHQQQIF